MTSSTVSILSAQVKENQEYCAHDFEHICLHLHHYDNYMHRKDRWEEGRGGFSSAIAAEKRGVIGEGRRVGRGGGEGGKGGVAGRQAMRIQWEVQSLQRQSNLTLLRTNARDQQTAMLSVQADELTAEADKPRV